MQLVEVFTLTDEYDLPFLEAEWRGHEAAKRRGEMMGCDVDLVEVEFDRKEGNVSYYTVRSYKKDEENA